MKEVEKIQDRISEVEKNDELFEEIDLELYEEEEERL